VIPVQFRVGVPIPACDAAQQAGLQKGHVAADVSRLKLSSLAPLFECSSETNDPAHTGCYNNVAADVRRLKLTSLARLFECSAEKNDPAHAGCHELSHELNELRPGSGP